MLSDEDADHMRNAAVAGASLIPIVGGPLSVVLDKYLPSYAERRREKLLSQLREDLDRLARRIAPGRLRSDEFLSVFVKAFRRAMEEHAQEKRDAFRAIIINTAVTTTAEFDEITLFLRLVSDLTVDQIRILRLLRDQAITDQTEGGLFQAMQRVWPEVDPDYLMACVTELLRYNLATSNPRSPGADPDRKVQHAITGLGHRFVAYIASPTSDGMPPASRTAES